MITISVCTQEKKYGIFRTCFSFDNTMKCEKINQILQ